MIGCTDHAVPCPATKTRDAFGFRSPVTRTPEQFGLCVRPSIPREQIEVCGVLGSEIDSFADVDSRLARAIHSASLINGAGDSEGSRHYCSM